VEDEKGMVYGLFCGTTIQAEPNYNMTMNDGGAKSIMILMINMCIYQIVGERLLISVASKHLKSSCFWATGRHLQGTQLLF